jgi:predicted RNase H-like nuclease
MTPVIGVDGCRAGWIAVIWSEQVQHRLFHTFADILKLDAAIIAVDMPIGLPSLAGRDAEKAARQGLGQRKSSVFPIPARPAVMSADYRDACAISLDHSDPPRKIAKQSFMLFPKIREIDALLTPDMQARVHETHPEVSFWAMNGKYPVPLAKKARLQNASPGLDLRRKLLKDAGFPIKDLPMATYRKSDVGDDDLIDACACAWSARRILEGRALHFPDIDIRDQRGLLMRITA